MRECIEPAIILVVIIVGQGLIYEYQIDVVAWVLSHLPENVANWIKGEINNGNY